jgi:uncharacterized protein YukE
MVLSNGTEVTGSLSTSSGIFTGNNGNDYFIGQNGIVQVTPQPDGSFKEPDGSVVMTAKSWSVDLEQLSTSTQMVQDIRAAISDAYLRIKFQYLEIMAAWQSPAGQSFDEVTSTIDRAMGQLDLVIATVIGAMQESHQNYQQAEQANTSNFTGS